MAGITDQQISDSYQIQMPTMDHVHMDTPYLDNVIDHQGILFRHYRAIPCPVGLSGTDAYDIRKTHQDHNNCSNGFIYDFVGCARVIFSSNPKELRHLDVGYLTGSTAQITVPRFYDDKPDEPLLLSPFDRLYLDKCKTLVVTFEKVEHNISGMDRARYPIVFVEFCMDSDGVRYQPNQDFTIVNGQIKWLTVKQPGMDPSTGKGKILAVRYRYTPFWYIERLIHEVRVHPTQNNETGTLDATRMPYAAVIQREYTFENEQNDPRNQNPNDTRQARAPSSGSFGPR